ncbi:helix-turn-helix domain-containing protein [Arthrobacter sp. MDT3-24]
MGKQAEEVNQIEVPARMSFRRMLSLEQVQEILNLGMPSIFALVKSGELRAPQFGGRNVWRVREDDLAAYIDAAYAKTAESTASGQLPEGDTPIDS